MGYTTDFEGEFKLDKPLKPEHKLYLEMFAGTRRMKRDATITATRPDPVREAVGLPVGFEGGYFVGASGFRGQEEMNHDAPGLLEFNWPASDQPGLWCQWVPSDDGEAIEWDGGEKFYCYVEWLEYIIKHFLQPWGYVLNGKVTYQGEDWSDKGFFLVWKNQVYLNEQPSVLEKIVDATE